MARILQVRLRVTGARYCCESLCQLLRSEQLVRAGLCDAHVHVTACTASLPGLLAMPESLVAARAARELNDMLLRGFTTVRDAGKSGVQLALVRRCCCCRLRLTGGSLLMGQRYAGGADFGLAQAVEEGAIVGPRLLFVGHALSQTGGHGDMRAKGEDCVACGAALRQVMQVCEKIARLCPHTANVLPSLADLHGGLQGHRSSV